MKRIAKLLLVGVVFGAFTFGAAAQETEEDARPWSFGFFSSPRFGGGSLMQGFAVMDWSETFSSQIRVSRGTETYTYSFAEPYDNSLGIATEEEYRIDLLPAQWRRKVLTFAAGVNISYDTTADYGFYRDPDEDDTVEFAETTTRLYLSPRVGVSFAVERGWLNVGATIMVSPLFGVFMTESFEYTPTLGEALTNESSAIGLGFPEVELETGIDIAERVRLDLSVVYRTFSVDAATIEYGALSGDEWYTVEARDYDSLRLMAGASFPIRAPNGSRMRLGAGYLYKIERDITGGTDRTGSGVSFVFGLDT